jgi:hypothetical protein
MSGSEEPVNALLVRAGDLVAGGEWEEAIGVYDTLAERYHDDDTSRVRPRVAETMAYKGAQMDQPTQELQLALCRHLDRGLGDVGLSKAVARGVRTATPERGLCGPEAVRSRENVGREGVGYNLRP